MISKLNFKFSIIVYFSFILFTIIGTSSHEFGHYIVGRYLGYQSTIHYGFTTWGESNLDNKLKMIYQENKSQIDSGNDFAQKKEFENLMKRSQNNHFLMTLGGPFQTILTGTTGCFLVFWLRKKRKYTTTKADWFCLFLALFWLRQPINLCSWILGKSFNRTGSRGDEINLSYYLNLPEGSIIITTGILDF